MHTRAAAVIVLMTSLGLAPATPTSSEPIRPRDNPALALAPVRPGALVRIEDGEGRVQQGRYVATTDGEVVLDKPATRVPAASIRKVWVRGRAVTTGAVIGGIVLGLPSALLGAAVGAYCEGDCGESDVYRFGAIGLALGAAVGSVTGGLVGSALPKWHRLDLGPPPAPRTGSGVIPGRIGSFSFQGGRAMGRDKNPGSGGFGGRLNLSAQLPGGLAPGLEYGRFDLGRGSVLSPRGRAVDFEASVRHFGFTLTKARDHGRLRPYGLASLGIYSGRGFNPITLNPEVEYLNPQRHDWFVGSSLGGGAQWRARPNLVLETEGRWHTSLHRVVQPTFDEPRQHWNMVSLTAGARFVW